jgi:SMI1 / KNR4 family (SUKH-1)
MRLPDDLIATPGPPLRGEHELRALEAQVGALPADYREFLQLHNGAELERCRFGRYNVRALWGIGFAPHYELLQRTAEELEQPEWLLPVGEDVFGNCFCVALAGAPVPGQMLFWDHELAPEEALTPIAGSFGAFLSGLVLQPPIELDHPPTGRHGTAALSGAIMFIEGDIEVFLAGRRSAENTKAWCRARVAGVLKRRWWRRTRGLRQALDAVDRAATPDELVAAMRAVAPELEALMPTWIAARQPGWALDERYLAERAGG